MDVAPVLKHADWDKLIAELAARPGSPLRSIGVTQLARAVLAAPAAIAHWIAAREPQLAAANRLRLLVIGAETVDAVDEGRWYALLPLLAGARFDVETTLVGETLDADFRSLGAPAAPSRVARLRRMSLAEFLRTPDAGDFDLAAVFHPGMQKNRGWLEDGSLARILAAGTVLVGASYELEEAKVEAFVMACHGYGVAGEPLLNPFYLDLSHQQTEVHWGRALWKFAQQVPAPGHVPDRERLDALDRLSRMVMHSMLADSSPSFPPGAPIDLQSPTGARLTLIHVFDRCCVHPESGTLYRLGESGDLLKIGTLGAAELAAYPRGGRELERALWAAQIKADRLLPRDDPARETGFGSGRAGGMLTTLRERARRLFQSPTG